MSQPPCFEGAQSHLRPLRSLGKRGRLRRLVTTSPTRDDTAVVSLYRGRHDAAVLSLARPNGDTSRADANGSVRIGPAATVLVITIATDLNVESFRQP